MKEKEFLKELGIRIAQIRKAKKIKQVDLANFCDFERQNMRRIEAGLTNPTTLTLRKIAEGLGMSLRDLFDFDVKGKLKKS